jgi:hypothetical protein
MHPGVEEALPRARCPDAYRLKLDFLPYEERSVQRYGLALDGVHRDSLPRYIPACIDAVGTPGSAHTLQQQGVAHLDEDLTLQAYLKLRAISAHSVRDRFPFASQSRSPLALVHAGSQHLKQLHLLLPRPLLVFQEVAAGQGPPHTAAKLHFSDTALGSGRYDNQRQGGRYGCNRDSAGDCSVRRFLH